MRRLLLKVSIVCSSTTMALLALVSGAQAAARAEGPTADQVVAELASEDATVSGLLKCWAHGHTCD